MQLSFLTSLFNLFFYPSSKSGLENYINRRKPQNIGEVERLEREYINKINSGGILWANYPHTYIYSLNYAEMLFAAIKSTIQQMGTIKKITV